MRFRRAEQPLHLPDLVSARSFFADCVAEVDQDRESLWVAHLDEGRHCTRLTRHQGDASGIDFPLAAIVADAAQHRSSAILLAHNHPSGDPTPSKADCRATRRLACAVEALDCAVADHLVFGGSNCASFRLMGLL